jgi:hypothetical protein
MTLLLVGIVAVILVILVAAFLTFRRGQDDDQGEPGGRWAVRDRVRSAGRDGHWRTSAQEMRRPRRPAEQSRRSADRLRGYDEPPPAYAAGRTGRGHRDQQDDRGYPARSTGRYADGPATPDQPASRGRGTRAAGSPPRGRPAPRQQPDGYDSGSYDSGPREQLYDTGPSPAMRDVTSVSGEHKFAPEHDDDSALTDSDVFPRIRTDTPPPTSAASKPQAPAKGRSRPSRSSKRGDDDDWPSTEWDKLSDEQYWAELSADKPLATTARSAQPSAANDLPATSGPTQPKPAQPRQSQPKPVQARSAAAPPGRSAPAPSGPAKPQPERESVAPRRRDRQGEHTEVLPVRARPRPAAPAATSQPSMPQQAGEPSLAMLTSLARTARGRRPEAAARDNDDPLTSPSFSRQATPAQDGRSYRSAGRDRPGGGTGDYPTGDYPTGDYPTGSYPNGGSGSYPNGSYPNGANGSGPQGYRADDRELTNPQNAYQSTWPGDQRPAAPPAAPAQPAPPLAAPLAPPPVPSRGPTGNPYGSYVDSAAGATTGGHTAGYPEDRARTEAGYGSYPTAPSPGYVDSGWHSAPPPAAPDSAADPASHYLYTGGSGYPDASGYDAGLPAPDASYPADYPEPAGYAAGAYNGAGYADGYSTDPYDPDAYGGYRPRQA